MKFTVYLPDDVGERVRAADDINLSRLLRDAVERELERRDQLAAATDGMASEQLRYNDRSGAPIVLRFTGKLIGGGASLDIYLTDTGKVLLVDEEDHVVFDDVEEFGDWLENPMRDNQGGHNEAALADAATLLGLPRVIEL